MPVVQGKQRYLSASDAQFYKRHTAGASRALEQQQEHSAVVYKAARLQGPVAESMCRRASAEGLSVLQVWDTTGLIWGTHAAAAEVGDVCSERQVLEEDTGSGVLRLRIDKDSRWGSQCDRCGRPMSSVLHLPVCQGRSHKSVGFSIGCVVVSPSNPMQGAQVYGVSHCTTNVRV